ncbi:hypothetical protein [Oceanobacillus sp. FSL W7-1281]|uniref:hypothetical protein n=1 Tax=Oceanobacillus sp. FSL W7-1281 TaxID=2921698 RepID=UPI0030DD222C
MSKLDPKPNQEKLNYSWSELNRMLQSNFNTPGITSATIDLDNFNIPKEEIIAEATEQGYTVTESSPGHLRFE